MIHSTLHSGLGQAMIEYLLVAAAIIGVLSLTIVPNIKNKAQATMNAAIDQIGR